MKLHVTHGRTVHELVVEPSTTLQNVRAQLQDLTGALARTQKLICKGRVLDSGDLTVEAIKLKDGAKLMLLCGAPGTQTQVRILPHWLSCQYAQQPQYAWLRARLCRALS